MPQLGTLEARQQRRQEIINRLEVLLKSAGAPYDKARLAELVNDVTGNTRNRSVVVPAAVALAGGESWCQASDMPAPAPVPNVFVLDNWDNENTDPDVVAGFILRNFNTDPVIVLNAQRSGAEINPGSRILRGIQPVVDAHYQANVKENASFFTKYTNAKTGLNNFLDGKDLDTQRQLLKRFAVAEIALSGDFDDENDARGFYDHLNQLNTGDCSDAKSIRKTLLAVEILKNGMSVAGTNTILDNVDDDMDNRYTADRTEAFVKLSDKIIRLEKSNSKVVIKKASIVFDSKKVDQRVVEALRDDDDKRTEFANAVVGINGCCSCC